MALHLPHRSLLSRAAVTVALGAALVPVAGLAPASAATKKSKAKSKLPTITKVVPMKLSVGDTLQLRGKHFTRGRAKNTVVFQRAGDKAVFVKADIGTAKLVKVTVPDALEKHLRVRNGFRVATVFRVRVLSKRFGRAFTRASLSPSIGPRPPAAPTPAPAPVVPADIDCDGDGAKNSVDADDDNDLLPDAAEQSINAQQGLSDANGMKTCSPDSDGDGVSDGYELRSAQDLNSTSALPAPGKRPYANPLDGRDTGTDFDGDGLSLSSEYRLWRYELRRTGRPASLDTLSYSDGTRFSIYTRDGAGRRQPALPVAGYDRQADFATWAAATGYGTVSIPGDSPRPLLDVNRDGTVSTARQSGYPYAENAYLDTDRDTWLDDGERDEDADGLSNLDETEGETLRFRLDQGYWSGLYPGEKAFTPVTYRGTEFDDADTDGDGIRDGADDQDFDDVPNLMELSRWAASGRIDPSDADDTYVLTPRPAFARVNPFNPCLPDPNSRTCPRYVPFTNAWAPFDDSRDYYSFR